MQKILTLLVSFVILLAQQDTQKIIEQNFENLSHRLDEIQKLIDDNLWFNRVGDVAFIDKLFIYGPPKSNVINPEAMGAKNPLKFWTYLFIPKNIDYNKKYPLLVFPHGGVHADFTTYYTHIVRELVAQGYVVVAPEYRGSTGYGKSFYESIDYGGLENEDCLYAKNFVLENYDFIDKNRVGIIGWSHGGMITLMNLFNYPDDYAVGFAGVPVSDLVMRMGYSEKYYRDLFSADYHIGKTPRENVDEYLRRSPYIHAHKLTKPLLIHTNTNDDDVYYIEVLNLINTLKANNKKFEYEIFKDAPGGHSFDRIDTKAAREIRVKIYNFLAKYLNPPTPIKNLKDLNKAAYIFNAK
ncbi:MAG TPA: prolyl oligopeptidase family serine peptidase [Ignavibacteriales bacterium]|nr:prolyl oligopeptidase family serine peptidase [Ignavibacteriales bacterium]HOL81719.1 prolyl oligopeptidase family serine peptidase [Ignavibacteriales bacterium]HOM66291.1 prolyl oligopeptidase family serine peptidase [Ignavibacteriales bacterium]HPP34445.1 prolyl oligopeptidase family serine peptidase [Ignavibacteriales bacterium]HRR19607.1 prolyl oligopeptidase family serine peptidase [Ignavibacteriales bacterium]